MPNYQNSKIYELICLTTGLRYIGSTTEKFLSRRLATHVRDCMTREYPCSAILIIQGGNYKINLLEKFPCNDINELMAKEYEYMKNLECVNKCRGLGINKDNQKATKHAYWIKHKDALMVKRRQNKLPAVGFDPTTSGL